MIGVLGGQKLIMSRIVRILQHVVLAEDPYAVGEGLLVQGRMSGPIPLTGFDAVPREQFPAAGDLPPQFGDPAVLPPPSVPRHPVHGTDDDRVPG